MKRRIALTSATLLFAIAFATTASATVITDATNDLHDGSGGGTDFTGFPHIDIASVEITNTATDITFKITTSADISSGSGTDWGKYMIGIDTGAAGTGDTGGNGWARPISMPDGMDYWIGSWVDGGGGFQVFEYTGSWVGGSVNGVDLSAATSGMVSYTTSLSSLGLSVGDTFYLDAYSSGGGGGDSAVDALSSASPSITDWGNQYTAPGRSGLPSYTVVPEPAAFMPLAFMGLMILRYRSRR